MRRSDPFRRRSRGSSRPKRPTLRCPEPACVSTGDHSVRQLYPGELERVKTRLDPQLFDAVKDHLYVNGYCSDVWAAGARLSIGKLAGLDFQVYPRDRIDILPGVR